MTREEMTTGIAVSLLDLIETIDTHAVAAAAITLLPFEDLTPETWESIQAAQGEAVALFQMFKDMIKMSGALLNDDEAMVTVERFVKNHTE